jgi:hypothetical protein
MPAIPPFPPLITCLVAPAPVTCFSWLAWTALPPSYSRPLHKPPPNWRPVPGRLTRTIRSHDVRALIWAVGASAARGCGAGAAG